LQWSRQFVRLLQITRTRDNGKDLLSPSSDLVVMEDGYRAKKISITRAIGITSQPPCRCLSDRGKCRLCREAGLQWDETSESTVAIASIVEIV